MVCKKCGCETLINEGDWLRCPKCGASFFNLNIGTENSVTHQLEQLEKRSTQQPVQKRPVNTARTTSVKPRPTEIKSEPQTDSSNNFQVQHSTAVESNNTNANTSNRNIHPISTPEPKEVIHDSSNQIVKNDGVDLSQISDDKEEKKSKKKKEKIEKPIEKPVEPESRKEKKQKAKKEKKAKKPKEAHSSDDSIESASNEETQVENIQNDENNVKVKRSKIRGFAEFLIPIACAVILALLLKTFVFANAVVPSGSMRETIETGDRIIASRISYVVDSPQRYDIIIFDYPDDESQAYVKRIIGLPGETITILDGEVYYSDVNEQLYKADSSFITTETPVGDFGPYYIPFKGEIISISGGYCYAENGEQVGSIDFLSMYCTQDDDGNYVVAQNLYFCMGDNRNDSHDARYWTNTYVAEDKIIGKVLFRYYPSVNKIE